MEAGFSPFGQDNFTPSCHLFSSLVLTLILILIQLTAPSNGG